MALILELGVYMTFFKKYTKNFLIYCPKIYVNTLGKSRLQACFCAEKKLLTGAIFSSIVGSEPQDVVVFGMDKTQPLGLTFKKGVIHGRNQKNRKARR